MGYETKLLIGYSTSLTTEECVYGELVVENGVAYRQILKDSDGSILKTGRMETWFQIVAEIDLCKCGNVALHNLDRVNTDERHHWYWFDGKQRTTEDCYGEKLKPVDIDDVIDALENDVANSDYHRFKWALSLLVAMKNGKENFSALLYGH